VTKIHQRALCYIRHPALTRQGPRLRACLWRTALPLEFQLSWCCLQRGTRYWMLLFISFGGGGCGAGFQIMLINVSFCSQPFCWRVSYRPATMNHEEWGEVLLGQIGITYSRVLTSQLYFSLTELLKPTRWGKKTFPAQKTTITWQLSFKSAPTLLPSAWRFLWPLAGSARGGAAGLGGSWEGADCVWCANNRAVL